MPKWLERELRAGGAKNPYALMKAADINKGDSKETVSRKMSRFSKGVHRRKRRKRQGMTAGEAAKTLVACLALLLISLGAKADEQRAGNFTYKYDVASATMTYCTLRGRAQSPWLEPIQSNVPIETSGSSTTVTAVTAGTNPFSAIAVGDVLIVYHDNTTDVRLVVAKTDADEVTVDVAVDWSAGYPFSWLQTTCGTTSTDGWLNVEGFEVVQMTVQYEAGDLDTLDVAWFCKEKGLGANAIRVYPGPSSDCGDGSLSGTVCTFASTGQGLTVRVPHNAFSQCRVGLKYGSSDGGTREQVTTTLSVAR